MSRRDNQKPKDLAIPGRARNHAPAAGAGNLILIDARLSSRLSRHKRGRPGPGLLAHVLVSKYCDHLPLYRQSRIFARDGIELDRSTLAGWVGKATALLEPLADAIGRHVLAGQALFADDTPVKLLPWNTAPAEDREADP